jgi:hypothetical protein
MEGRDKHNLIPVFEHVIAFALKFPIGIVDQNEDTRAADDAMSIPYERRKMLAHTLYYSP